MTGLPSGVRHEMVKVVAPVIGTVEAPPESEFWLKLPSGDVSVHEETPLVFQKIDVRAPRGTDSGTAQMSTSGGTVGAAGAAADVEVPFGSDICWTTTVVAAVGAGA